MIGAFTCSGARDLADFATEIHFGSEPKHANKIPRPKVDVSLVLQANVKVTAQKVHYDVEKMNRERSFGSTR